MSQEDGIHLTFYGYEKPGDTDYDSASAAGIGDHGNDLELGLSAALSQSERLARFGVTGKSTGQIFEYNGMLLRDDDTSPQLFRNIDIYSPAGPNKFGMRSGYDGREFTYTGGADEAGLTEPTDEEEPEETEEPEEKVYPGYEHLSEEEKKKYDKASENIPAKEKAEFQFKNVAPIDQVREKLPETRNLSDDDVVKQLSALYPEVPAKIMDLFARSPHGSKLIYDYINKGLTPLQQFKKTYPDFTNSLGSDDAIINWMHDNLHPEVNKDIFRETVSPAHPVVNALMNGLQGGWELGLSKAEEFPERFRDFVNNIDDQLFGEKLGLNKARQWLQKNVWKYGSTGDYFNKYLGELTRIGKEEQEKAKTELNKPVYGGWMGGTAQATGAILGQVPEQAMSFGMGLVPGILYEGISGYGELAEAGQRDAFLKGFVPHASFRWIFGLINNTPTGRLITGLNSGLASATETDIDGYLRGDRDNILTKMAKSGAINFIASTLFAHGPAKEYGFPRDLEPLDLAEKEYDRPLLPDTKIIVKDALPTSPNLPAPPPKKPVVLPPNVPPGPLTTVWKAPPREVPPIQKTQSVTLIHPETDKPINVKVGAPDKFIFGFSKKVNDDQEAAAQHQANGDHDKAIESLDRAFSLMTPEEKAPLGPKIIRKMDQLTKPPADQPPPTPEDEKFNQYYFSGLPITPKQLDDGLKFIYQGIKKAFLHPMRPEWQGETAEAFGQYVKAREAETQATATETPGELARAAGIDRMLKNGDRPGTRQNFFNWKSNAELYQYAIHFEEKNLHLIKDPVARHLFETTYKPWMQAVEARNKAHGIEHGSVENYIKHVFRHQSWWRPRMPSELGGGEGHGGPGFTQERTMSMRDHFNNGDKPLIYNPETLFRLADLMSGEECQKIDDAKEAVRMGEAYDKTDPKVPPGVVDGPHKWQTFNTPDGKSYYVSDKLVPILAAKFSKKNAFDWPIFGPIWRAVTWMKGTVAAKVAFSLFHPIHIGDGTISDAAATSTVRIMRGKGRWIDAFNVALNYVPGPVAYVPKLIHTYITNRDVVDAIQSRGKGFRNLSPEDQENYHILKEAGFVPSISEERQKQFHQFIIGAIERQIAKNKATLIPMRMVEHLISHVDFNKWWFGVMTPRLKAGAILARVNSLKVTHPELWNPVNKRLLQRAYLAINRDVESRFGEAHMNNMLMPRWAKDIGQGALLSMSWQAGLIETQAGGLMDIYKNLEHWKELEAGWKSAGMTGATKAMYLDRIAFQTHYVARALLTGAMINYLTGHPVENLMDMVYPRVWGKDDKGKDKRINMQFFIKEYPSLMHYWDQEGSFIGGVGALLKGKRNPMMGAFWEAAINRDWANKPIGDMPARLAYLFHQGMAPISFEDFLGADDATTADLIMGAMGYSPSGRWTSRTTLENKVMGQLENQPQDKEMMNLREKYRKAFLNDDEQGMNEAEDALSQKGLSGKQIFNIKKDADVDSSMKRFNELHHDVQLKDLEEMKPDEQKEWFKHASPDVREEFWDKHPDFDPMPKDDTGYYTPKTPQHALALRPGTRFRDPAGNLRMVPQNA